MECTKGLTSNKYTALIVTEVNILQKYNHIRHLESPNQLKMLPIYTTTLGQLKGQQWCVWDGFVQICMNIVWH
jgi:hypothetical protein